jgi:hypothetical protein
MDVETEVCPAALPVQSKNEIGGADVEAQVGLSELLAKAEVEMAEDDSPDEGRLQVL